MRSYKSSWLNRALETFAHQTTIWTGSSLAFLLASIMVVAWLVTGPLFGYSNAWQLVMNTISSIVTFLMVFLIQRSQNKDSMAVQVKLNELIAATKGASNRLINIEDLTEEELRALHERFSDLAERSQRTKGISAVLSIEQTLSRQEKNPAPTKAPELQGEASR